LLRRAYLKADAIVAVSEGLADDLARHAGIARDRISTVYNPVVGPDLLLKAGQPFDHPWFAAGAPPVILSAGRLHPQKDFATLIRAFARVRARRPARLMIIGARAATNAGHAVELHNLAIGLGHGASCLRPVKGIGYGSFSPRCAAGAASNNFARCSATVPCCY
jgi:glycosyltransferase involved in cell wall biosynthesis